MPSARVQRLAEAYNLWSDTKGGSVDHWLTLLADEVDFRSVTDDLAEVPFALPYETRDEVRQYLDGLVGGWEMVEFRVERFIEQGDEVVMVGAAAFRNRATGKLVDTPKIDLWRFRGDQAVSFYEMVDTAKIATCCRCD